MCWKLATSSTTILVGCFGILLTWNVVPRFLLKWLCSTASILVQVLSVLPLITSCCSPTNLFVEPLLLPFQELVLDQFVISLISLNLVSPQKSDLGSSHCVNHNRCNVLIAGKAMLWTNLQVLLLPIYVYWTSSFIDKVALLSKVSLKLVWYSIILLSVIIAQSSDE